MDRRRQLIRKNKNAEKNLVKREQKFAYRFLIFSMVAGVLNWVFWHDQFIGLDAKYTLLFIVLPLVLGFGVYYKLNRFFLKNMFKTKPGGRMDVVLSNFFLFVAALFFAYFSAVTLADGIFKLSMDFFMKDKPAITRTYIVTSTSKNNKGRGYHLFSHIRYIDEFGHKQTFDVKSGEVADSHEKRKITFDCKEGFWGYQKIVGYKLE